MVNEGQPVAQLLPDDRSLDALKEAAAGCRACDLWQKGTQTVFGEGPPQARVVMGVVVLGLLGGSAELARCPQLVSFSRAALPVPAEAQSSSGAGLGYAPVAFHASGNVPGVPRETLLKASMPVDRGRRPMNPAVGKPRRAAVRNSVLQRSRQDRARVQQVRGWVMLTSWDGSEDATQRPGMILSGGQERVISISYAAVPTAGGWLVIQL